MNIYMGIDVGAVAVKTAALSETGQLLFAAIRRHGGKTESAAKEMAEEIRNKFPSADIKAVITGSESSLPKGATLPIIPFSDARDAFLKTCPPAASLIEIGGETGRLTYLSHPFDVRENRICAGGTGAFLDNLAYLFGTDTAGLSAMAAKGSTLYPVASRCGVYAKTDVQGLLNEGAKREDLALSVFSGLADQFISGLAQGRRITGPVIFLGAPFAYLPALLDCFVKKLHLKEEERILPLNAAMYGALGAAMLAKEKGAPFEGTLRFFAGASETETLPPLFSSAPAYKDFTTRHAYPVKRGDAAKAKGAVFLGLDAGSTTIKAVLIGENNELLSLRYGKNGGDVLSAAKDMLLSILEDIPGAAHLAGCGVTGYGEELLKKAFSLDMGEVETMAHLKAAETLVPGVTALLDIGGQDMKFISLKNGMVRRVSLNTACASGCGAFLETFAASMGLTIQEFTKQALAAESAADLGSHCTVLMNSRVRTAQGDGIKGDAIAAGLCHSVVQNALTRVLKLESMDELGGRVVVEGGTFYNDAVLCAFERLTGKQAIRPEIAGLMGAYGMALLVKEKMGSAGASALISKEEIKNLTVQQDTFHCGGCGNLCRVSQQIFPNGDIFFTGNRCEIGARMAGAKRRDSKIDLFQWIHDHLPIPSRKGNKIVIIPQALNFWTDYPFWKGFFAALGYKVKPSSFSAEGMEETAMTIPGRIRCYPCALAHGHLWDALHGGADLVWMPAIKRGWDEEYTHRKRHALYGHVLAKFMKQDIAKANMRFLHPTLPELCNPKLETKLAKVFPEENEDSIASALCMARQELTRYERELGEETERIISEAKRQGAPIIILVGDPCQADPQIHKGLPWMISSLGAAVISADGIYCMEHQGIFRIPGGKRSLLDTAEAAAEFVRQEPTAQAVLVRSVSCGLERDAAELIRETLSELKKPCLEISLDQGTNLGAARIRIRTMLGEIKRNQPGKV